MIGLSITAIGQRPIKECIEIYYQLQQPLGLNYLELAIGSNCELSQIPEDIPLVVHNCCLDQNGRRLPFSLIQPDTWANYRSSLRDRQVLALTVHPPKLQEALGEQVLTQRQAIEQYMEVPVMLEVMPSPAYWLSQNNLLDVPLLLDLSHINIWHKANFKQVEKTCKTLLPRAQAIYISHNDGRTDSHDLIPNGIWFERLIDSWAVTKLVTYESLLQVWHKYERLDKHRLKLHCN